MQHPYHHQPATPATALALDSEAVITRQEALIRAGTHAMIAEKLARDAVCNQTLRDQHVKPVITPVPTVIDPIA